MAYIEMGIVQMNALNGHAHCFGMGQDSQGRNGDSSAGFQGLTSKR
jgi:hypothetical protein